MNDPSQTITDLLRKLRQGDDRVATDIFRRFAKRLVGLAYHRLSADLRRKVDPEDVVQSVFRTFFLRQRDGQFDISTWDNLWSLLAMITLRKCANANAHFHTQGRDASREQEGNTEGGTGDVGWNAIDREPSPVEAVMLTELVEHLLSSLKERDRKIISLSLEGKSIEEIAREIDRVERTVRRVLEDFRARLERVLAEPTSLDTIA